MTTRRATPVCVRCLINPTASVHYDTCEACWGDVMRAVTFDGIGPLADYLNEWRGQ